MRTVTNKYNVYTFDELNEAAKNKALTDHSQFLGEVWRDNDVKYDFRQILDILGFYNYDLYYSGFWSQGDGASFKATYKYIAGSTKALKEYAPKDTQLHKIAETLQAIQKKCFYRLFAAVNTRGNYCHEYTMYIDDISDYNGYRDFYAHEAELLEAFRDLARWYYKMLRSDYEYATGSENTKESIQINEYEFLDNGDIAPCVKH